MQEDQALILETMRRKAEGEKVFPEFAEFLSRHDPRLRRRALRALRDAAAADDVMQEARTRMFATGLLTAYLTAPKAYYTTVVKNCIVDSIRRAGRYRTSALEADSLPACDRDELHSAEDMLERLRRDASMHHVIEEALNRLKHRNEGGARAVYCLKLRYFEGVPPRHIARELGIDRSNTVCQIIRRALLALKEIIIQMIHEQFPTIEYALAF
jgi:RNA polymerase sigma factor (sigma-70 family)